MARDHGSLALGGSRANHQSLCCVMSTVTEKDMEVSPEPKTGLESEGSGTPKGPIKDNNLNSPLQVGARKKLFTQQSGSARVAVRMRW